MLIVGNKIDRVPPKSYHELREAIEAIHPNSDVLLVSATDHIDLAKLISAIEASEDRSCILVATLPITDASLSLLSALHDSTDIEETMTDDAVGIVLRCRMNEVQKLTGRIEAMGGVVVTTSDASSDDGIACEDRP